MKDFFSRMVWFLIFLFILTSCASLTKQGYSETPQFVIQSFDQKYRISSIAISSNSRFFATAHENKTLLLWDLRRGLILKKYSFPILVQSVKFSPGSRYLAFALKNSIQIVDIETGLVDSEIPSYSQDINDFYFSPDSTFVYVGRKSDYFVWDIHKKAYSYNNSSRSGLNIDLAGVAMNPEVLNSAIFGKFKKEENYTNVFNNFLNGKHLLNKGIDTSVATASISKDGKLVVAALLDNSIAIINKETETVIKNIVPNKQGFLNFEMEEDDTILISQLSGKSIQALTIESNSLKSKLSSEWKRGNKKIAHIELFSNEKEDVIQIKNGNNNLILEGKKIVFSQNYNYIGILLESAFNIYESREFGSVANLNFKRPITSATIDNTGKLVAIGFSDGDVIVQLVGSSGSKINFEKSQNIPFLEEVSAIGVDPHIAYYIKNFPSLDAKAEKIVNNAYALGFKEITSAEKKYKEPVFGGQMEGTILETFSQGHSTPITSLAFTKDGKYLISASNKNKTRFRDSNLIIWNIEDKKKELVVHGAPDKISNVYLSSDDSKIFVDANKESINVYKNHSEDLLYQIFVTESGDNVIITKDLYYKLGSSERIGGFAFSFKARSYDLTDFDLKFNRPDIVLETMSTKSPSEAKLQNLFYKLWKTRLKQSGITESSENLHVVRAKLDKELFRLSTLNTSSLKVSFSATDSLLLPIIGYKVFVNGVPLHGDYIKRTYPVTDKLINEKEISISESITLAQGDNKIEVSAFTEDGVESPRESFTVKYEPPVKRKPDLYFVGIGVDEYNPTVSGGLDTLTYAVKDSKELEDTFTKSGKTSFGNVFTKVITNKEVNQTSIRALRDFLGKSKVDDHVILFLSGHGIRKDTKISDLLVAFGDKIPEQYKLRDKGDLDDIYYYMTSEANVDKPWEKGIPLDGIRDLVNGIPSRQKIMLVDTCQSGEKLDLDDQTVASLTKNIEIRKTRGQTAKTRGLTMTTKPNKNEKPEDTEKKIIQSIAKTNALKEMSDLFPELRRGTGTIEISAATGAQSALESKEWQNGAFTFVIKEAILKGKAKDKSGNITAQSLRRYVLEEVEKLTDGQQTPMVARDIAGRDFVIFGK
jgi:WD40 repeat protein